MSLCNQLSVASRLLPHTSSGTLGSSEPQKPILLSSYYVFFQVGLVTENSWE